VQGTAERDPYSKAELDQMIASAMGALTQIRAAQKAVLARIGVEI